MLRKILPILIILFLIAACQTPGKATEPVKQTIEMPERIPLSPDVADLVPAAKTANYTLDETNS